MLRLRREVGDAIQSRFQPDRSKYYNLVKVVQECHPLPVEVLRGLSDNVSLIDTSCKSLLNALFAVKLHEHDREWMLAYSVFFENLVSAQACHLKAVAQHVTRLFCVYTRDATFDIVHNMIVTIVRLCPSGPKFLLPFVAKHFPFKDDPVPLVRRYVQHWLRLGRAIPLMRQPVFAILVRRLLSWDVELHSGEEDDDDKEHPAEALSRGLSHQDREEDEEDDEIGDDQIITTDLGQLFIRIDVFLTTLLEELRWLQKHLEETELEAFFTHSLSLLDEMVALRSSYTQYLWFFMASLHPNFANGMIGFLLMKFVDTDAHMSVRTGAASYLGSYLARAAYLPPAMLKMSARILMNWYTPDFATPAESRLTKARIERHAVFYYAFQALIYTLCFHWRTLLLDEAMPSASESRRHDADADENEEEDEDDAASLRSEMPVLQEVMQSRLQPLRVCQKHVVDRFAKVVHGLEIFYVF
ncbi:RRN3-domain-containing protein, partial [Caulochytrium protostelioides]